MSYTPVPTVNTGDLWSASQHNTYIKENFAAGVPDIFTAKGDLPAASAADAAGRLAVGSNGQVLKADSTQSLGLAWASIIGRRQGGDPSAWSLYGTTDYTPTAALIQVGVIRWTGSATGGNIAVTFPTAYSQNPIVIASAQNPSASNAIAVSPATASTTAVTFHWEDVGGGTQTSVIINWIAIGPP